MGASERFDQHQAGAGIDCGSMNSVRYCTKGYARMIYTKDFDFAFIIDGYEHRGHLTIRTSWPGTLRASEQEDRRMHRVIAELVRSKGPNAMLLSVSRTEAHQVLIDPVQMDARNAVAQTIAQAQAQALAQAQARRDFAARWLGQAQADPGPGTGFKA